MANDSCGKAYLLDFEGTRDYKGITRDLSYETNPKMTSDEVHKGLVKQIKAGLLRYAV
ncbi:MAG: hypothetical protein ACJAWH_000400 [Maribacter sp.]|jgi:hypothetical protein